MKTREEIEKNIRRGDVFQILIVELLLDIINLLIKLEENYKLNRKIYISTIF